MNSSEQKIANRLELIMFDFDGVISTGRFYVSQKYKNDPKIEIIRKHIFEDEKKDLLRAWMKGQTNYQRIHRQLSKKTGLEVQYINNALIESISEMNIHAEMLNFSNRLRTQGVKSVLVTDNMDIFDQYTVPFHELHNYFDHIYSSSQHGLMKNEQGGEIFKQILRDFQVEPSATAFTDDSPRTGEIAQTLGLKFFYIRNMKDHFQYFMNG